MARSIQLPREPTAAFATGLDRIRTEHKVPAAFPPEVIAEAEGAAGRPLGAEHVDRTARSFVTLDPASSTDLDQAFAIERSGADLLLHYAIADVAYFVRPGGALDNEAWARGVTIYLPDSRTPLYPPILSEGAASLLPDGPRAAVVFTVRQDPEGSVSLDGVERAVIRSRAKLAYETATAADLPDAFEEFAARAAQAEIARGASQVESPEQEVEPDGDGGYRLVFRPRLANEVANAALSLSTNLAVADLLRAHHTGLFRVMPDPDERAITRLRNTARGLGVRWDREQSLREVERTLRPDVPEHAAFQLAVRRATGGASYAAFTPGETPWHSAVAASYSHATAPLRRLADRFVVHAALAVANGEPVPADLEEAFSRLPDAMQRADAKASQVERAAIDLTEAIVLDGREGAIFDAVVTDADERGARIQLLEPAVIARVEAHRVEPGDTIRVRLVDADPSARQVRFERVS